MGQDLHDSLGGHLTGIALLGKALAQRAVMVEPSKGLREEFARLVERNASATATQWLDLYARACEQRRKEHLATVLSQAPRIVFIKHRTLRPSFFAYTEGQSDAQNERHFDPGAELCLLTAKNTIFCANVDEDGHGTSETVVSSAIACVF